VVPARNVERVLQHQLVALGNQLRSLRAELVIVDDASNDDTAGVALRWADAHPDLAVTVLTTDRRRGTNASRNAGVRSTTAPIVCFTDGDDIVDDGWLHRLLSAARGFPIVGGGYRMLYDDGDPDSATASETVIAEPFDLVGVPYPPGSCMAMQRWVFDRIDGFDENVWRGGTEADFFVRAYRDLGLTYRFVDGATVRYRVSPGWRQEVRRMTTRARGQGYLTNVYRRDTSFPAPVTHSMRSCGRQLAKAVVGLGTGPDRGHHLAVSIGALSRTFWLLRYRVGLPKRVSSPADHGLRHHRLAVRDGSARPPMLASPNIAASVRRTRRSGADPNEVAPRP
jgi:hypothetical protein